MNKPRRKRIADIISRLHTVEEELQAIREEIEEIGEEEQEYLDSIPDNLQSSERYEKAENAVACIESAIDNIDCMDFEEITSFLEEAAE